MLSGPRGFGFVLAVVLGAMLVPGCRPKMVLPGLSHQQNHLPLSTTRATISGQYSGSRLNALEGAE